MQHINAAGLELIKRHEGLRLRAYQDAGGVWTIGWGHTAGVQPGQCISMAQAEELLQRDLAVAESSVNEVGTYLILNANQFSALVSFAFNCGVAAFVGSHLCALVAGGDFGGAAAEFGRWVHGKVGERFEVLPELVARRADERALFMRPVGVA